MVEGDRRHRPPVRVEGGHARQVEVGEDVAVQGEERALADVLHGVDDGPTRAEGLLLRDPPDLRVASAGPDEIVERGLEVRGRQHDLVHPMQGDVVEDVV